MGPRPYLPMTDQHLPNVLVMFGLRALHEIIKIDNSRSLPLDNDLVSHQYSLATHALNLDNLAAKKLDLCLWLIYYIRCKLSRQCERKIKQDFSWVQTNENHFMSHRFLY